MGCLFPYNGHVYLIDKGHVVNVWSLEKKGGFVLIYEAYNLIFFETVINYYYNVLSYYNIKNVIRNSHYNYSYSYGSFIIMFNYFKRKKTQIDVFKGVLNGFYLSHIYNVYINYFKRNAIIICPFSDNFLYFYSF